MFPYVYVYRYYCLAFLTIPILFQYSQMFLFYIRWDLPWNNQFDVLNVIRIALVEDVIFVLFTKKTMTFISH